MEIRPDIHERFEAIRARVLGEGETDAAPDVREDEAIPDSDGVVATPVETPVLNERDIARGIAQRRIAIWQMQADLAILEAARELLEDGATNYLPVYTACRLAAEYITESL